jgi:hypothetical protein
MPFRGRPQFGSLLTQTSFSLSICAPPGKAAWAGLCVEKLIEELQQIRQFVLLYPRQGQRGSDRAAYVLSKQSLAQHGRAKALKLDELQITLRG